MKTHLLSLLLAITGLLSTSCLTDQDNRPVAVDGKSFEVKVSGLILGEDDRKLIPSGHVDHSTVAIVKGADSTVCTGTTIGLSHVLTAAHCLYDTRKKELKKDLSVIPGLHMAKGYIGGSRFFIERVYILKTYLEEINYNGFNDYSSSKDIAVIQVKEYQGNKFFSEQSPKIEIGDINDFRYEGFKLDMIAYHSRASSQKSSQYFINECYTTGRNYHYTGFTHDCDITKGSSGTGIIANQKIYGVQSAENQTRGHNLGALITFDLLEDLRKIQLYKTEGLEKFEVFDFDSPTYSSVSVENNCNDIVDFTIAYKDLQGRTKATQLESLQPRSLKLLSLKTKADQVHVYGITKSRTKTWDGSYSLSHSDGSIFDYMTVDLENYRGNTNLKFNCN